MNPKKVKECPIIQKGGKQKTSSVEYVVTTKPGRIWKMKNYWCDWGSKCREWVSRLEGEGCCSGEENPYGIMGCET